MAPISGTNRARRRQLIGTAVFFSAVVAVVGLGFAGFTQHFEILGENKTRLDRFYLTWQLFTLESGSVDGPVPLMLEAARVLAPILAAFAIVKVLLLFLGEWWNRVRIQWQSGHVVVCGMTDAGLHVAMSARAAKLKVVVIDANPDAGLRDRWKEHGGYFLEGDATEPATLDRAGIHRAHALVAVHGDDGRNVSTAISAERALESDAARHQANPLACHVQIADYELAALFKASPIFVRKDGPLDMDVFSAYDAAARITSRDHPLDRERIAADDTRTPHLIVLGLSRMGTSLAVQYAKVAHLANGRKLRVTVFDREATRCEQSLLSRHPAMADVCDLRFIGAEFEDGRTMPRLRDVAATEGQLVTIAICVRGDSKALACALAAHAAMPGLDLPVLVRMSTLDGLASLLQTRTGGVRLVPFGTIEQINQWSTLDTEVLDKQALEVHRLYREKRQADGMPPGAADADWRMLDIAFQDSCRQQADHIPVKLRAIGCEIVPLAGGAPSEFAFTGDEIELLAAMEHARWVAERRLAGWRPGPKDIARKITPYLVDYDDLEEQIKDYDRDAVRNLPKLVGMAGGCIRRS